MENQAQDSKSDIKVELLQFANTQVHVVKEEIREMLRTDVDGHKKEIKRQNWRAIKIGLTVLSLLVGANVLTLYRGYQWAQNRVKEALETEVRSIRKTVSERLDQEFQTKRIRTLIEERAKEYTEKQAQLYITESVEKSFKPLSVKLQNDVKSFDSYLKDTRDKIVKEYTTLSAEINTLKELNRLSLLGARALVDGVSDAFTDLETYSNDPKKQSFKIFAVAEILKVKGFYISVTRIKGIILPYTAPDGSKKTEAEIPTRILISFLSSSDWPSRAKAAELLANRSEKGVPEALIKAFNDSNLDVRKIALDFSSTVALE